MWFIYLLLVVSGVTRLDDVCLILERLEAGHPESVQQRGYVRTANLIAKQAFPDVDEKVAIENTFYAVKAKLNTEWGKQLDDIVFFNDVLPVRSFTEPVENWRKVFYPYFIKFTENSRNSTEVVFRLMTEAFSITDPKMEFISAKLNKINNYSPFESMEGKYTNGIPGASCTGMAIFFVNVLRSISIPARVVGVPHWNTPECRPTCGNHNWIEYYEVESKKWQFISLFDLKNLNLQNFRNKASFVPSKTRYSIRSTWFSIYATSLFPAKCLVHHPAYARDGITDYFPLVWSYRNESLIKNEDVHAFEVLERYQEYK